LGPDMKARKTSRPETAREAIFWWK